MSAAESGRGRAAAADGPGTMTRRLCAAVLASQAPVVVFAAVGARGLALSADDPNAGRHLLIGCLIAGFCVTAAALTRFRWGIALGWLAQLATLAYALIVPMMVVVGLIFGGLWITAVVQGQKMDALTRRASGTS